MRSAFRHTVLRKYDVQYFQCGGCGFLQTETPYWLDEAYSSAIVTADTGICFLAAVSRAGEVSGRGWRLWAVHAPDARCRLRLLLV
jgi:hypothetical protein